MPKRNHSLDYEKRLLEALQDLEKDPTLLIAKAAGHRGVPATTVRDRKNKGAQNPKSAHQHECLLSSAQEDVLVKWALFQDDMGIPPCQELLREKAEAILHITNPDINIGK